MIDLPLWRGPAVMKKPPFFYALADLAWNFASKIKVAYYSYDGLLQPNF